LFIEEKDFNDGFYCLEEESQMVYTPLYHEVIACILNQATVLKSDESYMYCINKRKENHKKVSLDKHFHKVIHKLYFNKKDLFNKLLFNLFDGILNSIGALKNDDGSPK